MGWQDDPITEARVAPEKAPWENDPITGARTASGVLDAIQAGYQGSATGLAVRGKLPDVVLDPSHTKWYENALATTAQTASDIPEMIAGGAVGAVAGTAAAGPIGGVLGTGAGAFGIPAAIRTSLIEAYKSGTAQTSGGFLKSAKIILQQTGKEAAIGALTFGAGAVASRIVGGAVAPLIGEQLSARTATRAIGAASTAAEVPTMVVASSALDGKLPEWEDFLNAAIVVGGMKASVGIASKIGDIYARTGITPDRVVAAAKADPTITLDLKPVEPPTGEGVVAYHGTVPVFDKFDAAKIGTGEGAQAYGHGINLAEQPAVAESYKQALLAKDPVATQGSLYKVEIAQKAANNLLDWDVPLSEQAPQVKAALTKMDNPIVQEALARDWKGGKLYAMLSDSLKDERQIEGAPAGVTEVKSGHPATSQMLHEAGIFGTKYLDAGSRSRADATGTRNFVIFDPNDIRITERNGEPLDLPRAFQPVANEESARNAILLPDQARAFVDKPFAEVPQAPGAPKVALNVNYDYINTPAEAKAALARASEIYGQQIIEQTRGKVSWEQTENDAAKKLAEMVGTQDFSMLQPRTPGTAEGAVDLLLRRQILEGAVEDFTAKARTYDPANSTPEHAIQMLAAAERVAMLSAQFQGAASEAGRALNILQNARDTARSAEEVAKLLKLYDRDPATIAAIMKEVNNPVAAAKVARELVKATTFEKFAEAMKSAMISGPVTIGANIIGNMTFLPLRPVIDAMAVPLGLAREIMSGKPADRVRAVEPIARIVGNYQGAVDALIAAGSFIRANVNTPMEGLRELDKMGARKVEVQKRAIEGDMGVAVRSPFLALSIPDRFFRYMIERGEMNAMAARQAAKEGLNPFTREFRERMAEVRQNLTSEQIKEAEAVGNRGTFNADLGPKGKAVQNAIREGGIIGFLVAPFLRTPFNLAKELVRLTPGAPIIDTWRADVAKGGPAADRAMAEMLVGGAVASVVVSLAQSGLITGAGEPDPNKKRTDLAAGEQPYSIKGPDGKWYEYSRLQPLGTLVGLAADFSSIWDAMSDPQERDRVIKMIGVAFSSAITNQTMLLGLSNIVRAISDPDPFFERYVQGLAAMPVPGALSQWSQLNDPYMREIHSVMDAIKNRTPARTSLQPKVDIWGEFVENRERVGGIGPSRIMEPSQDKVKTEAARLNIPVPKTPDHITLPAARDAKLGKVELTPEQQTAYAVIAGHKAHDLMAPLVSAKDWDARPDMVKTLIYQRVLEKSREYARAQIIPAEQRAEESRRIADEIQRRMSSGH